MSLEKEDESSAMEASESINESQKKPKISYTRDFLLSLSELEVCKRLPIGFDQSVLSEFEDISIQERPRSHGNLPLQGFRRNDYSSSPPTRGDSSNFSRAVYGRWDNRSSGLSDKDGDSQSDLDPDSGRRSYGNQSRRPWQNSEHDGLLGSGSFPRPSGFAAGTSAPKGQTNEHYHLNKSNEAYHPPRPFKAVPHSRTSTHDSFNDETFGSSECTSQDREEEERKRRASFELMRKEQQKVLQEKQKSNANKHKSDGFTDLILEETKEEGLSEASGELNSAVQSVPNDDSGKSSILLQSSKSRPLVPPGFRSTILDKSSTTRPLISSTNKENPKPGIEEIHLLAKGNHTQNGTLDNQGNIQSVHKLDMTEQYLQDKNICGLKQGEAIMSSSSGSVVSTEKLGMGDHHLHRISGFPEVHEAVDGEVFELMTNKVMGNKILCNSSQESMTSILGNFFGSAPTIKDGGSTASLEQKSKPDDPLSPRNVQSSRFAQWFNEDEKKPVDDLSSSRPNDLLSLIVGGDKAGSQVPSIISTNPIAPELSYEGFGVTKTPSDSKHLYNSYRQESAPPVAAVLTCEDLEQTIMSEYSEKSSTLQPSVPDWSVSGQENMDARVVDNHATHHLLSLLQKATTIDDMKSSNTNIGLSENRPTSEVGGVKTFENPKDSNQEAVHSSGQNLSLEALFGTAFMKELQSTQAPVSVQRGSAGSARTDVVEPHELSLPVMNGPLSSSVDGIRSNMTNYESSPLFSKQKQPAKSDDAESWLNFNGPRVDVDPLELQRGVPKSAKQAIGMGEIQLPEEESLITVGLSANTHNPMSIAAGNTTIGKLLPSDAAFDISEKLAVLNSGFRGERSMAAQEGTRFVHGPYDILEPERQFNNLHAQASSPQMHAAQMNHNRRPMFHPLDPNPPHMNSQMRFPEHLMQRDTPLNQQYPANMSHPFHHPDTRVTGFDVPAHPQMLSQMRMQGNFPPPHLLRDLPRPLPVHPRPSNQASNFMPDREAMHGFPFAHQQTNIGLRMPIPVPDAGSGSNHPEALQRMMEMELRAQSKQVRPLNPAHTQGMYGHELDMGFGYR